MEYRRITLEIESGWVLAHRDFDLLPIDYFIALCNAEFDSANVCVESSSLTSCVIVVGAIDTKAIDKLVRDILADKLQLDKDSMLLSFDEAKPPKPALEEARPDLKKNLKAALASFTGAMQQAAPASDENAPAAIDNAEETTVGELQAKSKALTKIDALVAAEDFKTLAREIICVAPQISRYLAHNSFVNRHYLFSINDGYGLSTALQLLAELVEEQNLFSPHASTPLEVRVPGHGKEGPVSTSIYNQLLIEEPMFGVGGQIICLDICEWMSNISDKRFREFIDDLGASTKKCIYVFRVPFVEKRVLYSVRQFIGDVLYIRTVSFRPFEYEELALCARSYIEQMGFTMDDDAWVVFERRIAIEKSDGRFYGIRTVQKVVYELIYNKLLSNAITGDNTSTISASNISGLIAGYDDGAKSGMEMLDDLVGMEDIKSRIVEIVMQVKMALAEKRVEAPSIHMCFVGNPGTGKTTVARILGKIFKENGVLRCGGFFEFSGRDFCGRYIGETAPKTTAMCRDAYGSVLFIDEAYSLYRGNDDSRDFGREALDTLIAEMENHRNDMLIIMAGYPDEMNTLLNANPGIRSRMPFTIEFKNYNCKQLFQMFMLMVNKSFICDETFERTVRDFFDNIPSAFIEAKEFGNGRFVRNLFERTWAKAATRRQFEKNGEELMLTASDFIQATLEREFAFESGSKHKNKPMGFELPLE